MAGELILNEVAQPSTPAAGKDNLYMSSGTLPRLNRLDSGGHVWPIQEMLLCSLASSYTLDSTVTTAQKAFNATTNGAITLPAGSSFLFEANYLVTNTGTTSHTWAVLFGGTATLTSGQFAAQGISNAVATVDGYTSTPGTALVVSAASTSSTEALSIYLTGVIRVNTAGTFIPQVQLSAATGGVATMLANSYILLTPFGTNTATTLGAWS